MSERDYSGGAGYATRQDPSTIPSGAELGKEHGWHRERRPVLPAGRALDEWDLADMLHTNNETSRARIMRARLCAWAAPQLKSLILLDARELETLEHHLEGRDKDGKPYVHRPAGMKVALPEWPRTAGQ